jgi:hypothetical protein
MTSPAPADQISIVAFIDALGWEVLADHQFLEDELPYRRKLRSVLGFSSACVPSILTGRFPQEHEHWSFYFKARRRSPFGNLRWLGLLPSALVDRGRVRAKLSAVLKRLYGFQGYFQLYNVPFDQLSRLDYCEKRDLFAPGGINRGESIFDALTRAGVRYHVSDWRRPEAENLRQLRHDLERREATFAFLYLADLDGLLHRVGKHSPEIGSKLAWYERAFRELLECARRNYSEVRLHVCSDHGMASVHTTVDLMGAIDALGFEQGRDYLAVYDSTMARFWFHNDRARAAIVEHLESVSAGRILPDHELDALGCRFEGDRFGELIFLLDAGHLIVPSHMGRDPIAGMHGYHPDHPDSDASLLSSTPPPGNLACITDIYGLMRAEAGI